MNRLQCKLQALVYDFLPTRKVPESAARSVTYEVKLGNENVKMMSINSEHNTLRALESK